jgi:hypothetical protein
MNIKDIKEIQSLLDKNYRVLFYKEENDPNTPDSGPYRLMVFKYPPLKDKPYYVIASGENLEVVAEEFKTVEDFDAVLQIEKDSHDDN